MTTVPPGAGGTADHPAAPIWPLTVRVLGPLEVTDASGRHREIAQPRQRAVLAALACVPPGQTMPIQELVEAVWGEHPPSSARKTLHGFIARLRRTLGAEALLTRPGGYAFSADLVRTDLQMLMDAVAAGRASDGPPNLARLTSAVAMFRGVPFADIESGSLHERFGAGLAERRMAVLEAWARAAVPVSPDEVISRLRVALAEDPLRESLWALLISAQNAAGRRHDALAGYREIRARLRDELGLEPGPELQRAHREALTGAGPSSRTPAPSVTAAPAEVLARSAPDGAGPGVVVLGPPGSGKSHWAVSAVRAAAGRYPGGHLVVSLLDQEPEPAAALSAVWRTWSSRAVPDAGALGYQVRRLWAEARAVIILDDVATAEQIQPFLPVPPSGALVVCAARDLGTAAQVPELRLGRYHDDQVVRILAEAAGRPAWTAHHTAARALVRMTEGLPAAAYGVARLIHDDPFRDLTRLAHRLRDPDSRLDALRSGGVAISARFGKAYRLLSPAAQRAYRLLSWVKTTRIGVGMASACLLLATDETRAVLDELAAFGMIDVHPARPGNYYQVRELDRAFGRRLSSTVDDAFTRDAAVRRALAHWRSPYRPGDDPAQAGPGMSPPGRARAL